MKVDSFALILCILGLLSCTDKIENINSHSSTSKKGIVAAGKSGSTEAGLSILEKGGNAADAAAATILALSITDFDDFCIGAEVPLMIYSADKKEVKVLSGQGRSPLSEKAMEWYYKNGIPLEDIKAAAVPGVIDLCIVTLKEYGTMTFKEVVSPSLKLLQQEEKYDWYPDLLRTLNLLIETEEQHEGSREDKLQAVADRFYRGDIADSLASWYQEMGGFLTKEDLENHRTTIEDPISITYKDYTIYKCDTWTQGGVLLQSLKLLETYDFQSINCLSSEHIHLVTEAMKLAFADRDEYYGDPEFVEVPLKNLLSDEYTDIRRGLIDLKKASNECRPGDPFNNLPIKNGGVFEQWDGGTTTCAIVDKWGNMVAATPSGWGSNAGSGGGTGIVHGTRLRSLNTKAGHPNCIEPGKRPRITLTPTLVFKNNKPLMAISVAGGDVQDQTTLNILLNIIEYDMSPFDAVSASRFATTLLQDSFDPDSIRENTINQERFLEINSDIDSSAISKLGKMGHHIKTVDGALAIPAIVYIDQSKQIYYGATDPRTDHFTGAIK